MSLNISINYQNEYYLQLDSELQGLFTQCVEKLRHGEMMVHTNLRYSKEIEKRIELLNTAIDLGCPELFFFDKKVEIMQDASGVSIIYNSKYPKEELSSMYNELMNAVNSIVTQINNYTDSDEEKLRLINEYACYNIRTVGSTEKEYGDAYGALINQAARCEGICKGVQLILDKLNIRNMTAFGDSVKVGQEEKHSWTIAWIDGKPYGFDFTWNIGATNFDIPSCDYMFLPKSDMDMEHKADEQFSFPIAEYSNLTEWYLDGTEIAYRSDMENIIFKTYGNNQYAVLRFLFDIDYSEIKDNVRDWYLYEMSGDTMYGNFYYQYNEGLRVLTVYVITNDY